MNYKDLMVFDIETEANEDACKQMPDPKAPANYKDEEKIATYVAEKKAEMLSSAALDADLNKVVCISLRHGVEGETKVLMVGDEATPDEKSLLTAFWSHFAYCNGQTVGFNTLGFDFPVLMRRSFDYGIKLPCPPPVLAKYRNEPTTDLMGILFNWDKSKGLKWVCKRYGIDNPLPDLDGSMFAEMDVETKRKYSGNDIHLTIGLLKRMAGIYLPSIR